MKLRPGVSAWTLRATILVACALVVTLLTAQQVATLPVIVVAVLGALATLVPASPAPALLILITAALVALVNDDPLSWGVVVYAPLLHVVHTTCALAAVIPGTARVHPSALRATVSRFVVVQAAVLGLVVAASVAPSGATPAALEIAALIGVAGLAGLALKLIMNRPQ